ncbi:hypothetical protein L3Y21_gp055 [Gordonia phage Rabbitrun]|uniref:Uncharacterized protein n=1 Tax=Gordonia phage Rabbitrun TaxID=2762280 RepID=A0A7G8LIM6_9CAUD|nr:hypothetical protein L3Y21_gp055 [Gordonia phage Rabbitrun]QNJ57098.1 hypothetical protein SEA_RABBITRUN_55 [Gordonia phage Rabbitrun]
MVLIGKTEFEEFTPQVEASLVAAVVEIATEKPDFKYRPPFEHDDACYYEVAGQPSCIIGRGFSKIGFTGRELKAFDDCGQSNAESILLALGASEHVARWAQAVQEMQDCGKLWGEALFTADQTHGRPEVKA